jgi:AraC-like DNA-binding protein/CheY-like chemotaxis protein
MLEDDYEVLDAPDARSAVEIARTAPIDLVVLDIFMPNVDGLEILPELQTVRPGVPVVVVSGVDRASTATTAMRLGAVDYLTKPFDIDILLAAIDGALHRRPRPRVALPRQPFPTLALIGCSASIVAGLAATLTSEVDVRSHRDPPAVEALTEVGAPAMIVVNAQGRRMDWLGRAALLVDRCSTTPIVLLLDARSTLDARFAFGERCLALEHPLQLAALLELVCSALPEASARRPWRDERTAAVIDAVAADYARFRLSSLADRLGVSPYYLSRLFHRHVGVSLASYLTRVRVHAARQLLEQNGTKLDAVALAVGFHDASHLSRAFVRVLGHRPGSIAQALSRSLNGRSVVDTASGR